MTDVTDIAASEALLIAVSDQIAEIGILLNEAISEIVTTSINWHETIAAMRGEICQKTADLACKIDVGPERDFVHAEVHRQVQTLFDEILTVIDNWALRVMSPESSKSGARNLH
ncbi:hypothetical protein [Rhizobium sp. RCC_161_2]|uniref:hypothetical protein n=1 Tax=Rhizobium sp. RCC_161_2 TaxID=3239219 RepID=UPI0035245A0F